MKISLKSVYELFNSRYDGKPPAFITGVSIDSRTIREGDLFFAIKGDNFDGHDFVKDILSKKGVYAICSKPVDDINSDRIIYVDDTLTALGQFASFYKSLFNIPTVAITGSNGKTTTKNMINAALSQKYTTACTKGNFNNQTGVPLTVFSIDDESTAAIIEMGMNNKGEIAYLSKMVNPDIGLITNIGTGHIGNLGSRLAIFEAKTELIANIKKGGHLIVNKDDDLLCTLKSTKDYGVVTFSVKSDDADYFAYDLALNPDKTYSFTFKNERIKLSLPGLHNVYNALSSLVIADLLNVDSKKAAHAISDYTDTVMRSEVVKINGFTVINDAYNANYDSMIASLDLLFEYDQRKVAILGDMLELGRYEVLFHEKVGAYAANKVDVLIFIGKNKDNCYNGAISEGMNKDDIYLFENTEIAKKTVKGLLKENDVILIKGSRGSRMEKMMEIFKGGDLC